MLDAAEFWKIKTAGGNFWDTLRAEWAKIKQGQLNYESGHKSWSVLHRGACKAAVQAKVPSVPLSLSLSLSLSRPGAPAGAVRTGLCVCVCAVLCTHTHTHTDRVSQSVGSLEAAGVRVVLHVPWALSGLFLYPSFPARWQLYLALPVEGCFHTGKATTS